MLRCGLLGKKLGHSYSPQIHGLLGDYEYLLYEKAENELEEFLTKGIWNGLNVTIPYKKTVIRYCSELSETARITGTVNTLVKREDGSIFGDNTDAFGFKCLLDKNRLDPEGRKVLILGNGGACASVKAVLNAMGAEVKVISRKGQDNYDNLEIHKDARMIVNTTPVGMYPDNGKSPVDLKKFPECKGIVDIIYNPRRTAFTLQAEELGITNDTGLYMLVAQAKRSSELFTGKSISDDIIRKIYEQLLLEMQNIVLIGMPGSGKSLISSLLGEMTGRETADMDLEFERVNGITPAECIKTFGEAAFRDMETKLIGEYGKKSGIIISTGGGAVTKAENYPLLHQNGVIVWIKRDIGSLPVDGRPLSQLDGVKKLYENRKHLYESFADITADNNGRPEDAARIILEQIKKTDR